MAVDVGSAKGYLDLDISGFLAGLSKANDEADKQTKNLATKIGGNISKVGNGLTSAGTTLTKKVTLPILGIGAAGIKVASDFEKGMSEVKAISGATGKDFDALREKAVDLGASTAFSAGEVAEAMTEMAKAGWSSQQIIDGMAGVLNAAAASGEGLATVSTIVADTITGFGMAASDSSKIADLLTQAANSGTIGITDLGESFKYIAPVAGAMGLSVEDVTTAISAMSMAGIKGSQAGTSLRTMLTRMVKPTDAVATAMDELGLELTNSDGTFKSLDEIVAMMRGSFSGLTDEQKTYYATVLAGQEGMSGMLSLLNLTEEEYNAIAESMDNAGGVATETAAIMQDNLQSKVEQLGGSLESLAIKLGDLLIPHIQKFVEWLTSLIDKFTSLDPETQKTILKFAGLALVAGPVVTVLGKITSGVGGVFTAFGKLSGGFKAVSMGASAGTGALAKFGGALAGITAPIAAVIAIVGVLVAAFTSLWKTNEEFRDSITAIWNQITETFNNFTQGIVDRLNALGFDFENITEVLKALWEGFCNFLAPIFEGAFQFIADTLGVFFDIILGILDIFIGLFTGNWDQMWNGVKNIFGSVWDWIVNTLTNIGNTLFGIFETILGWFGTSWSECWSGISTFFMNIWNGIATFFTNILNGIVAFFTSVWNGIATFFTNIWNGIRDTISNVVNSIKTTITNVFNSVKDTVTNIFNGIKNAISVPINAAKSIISNVVNSIKNIFSNGFNAVKNTVSGVFNGIKNTISNILDSAKNIVSNAVNKIKSIFNFKWSFPKLKLPHFSIKGSFSLNPLSVPKLSIDWYKKAMSGGMILNSPTIFGYDEKSGQFLGGGEAGSETIVGTSSLMSMIRQAVGDAIKPIIAVTHQLAKASNELGYITYNSFAKQAQVFEKVAASEIASSGDTFIFNSPKAIDEIEAAKQIKKTKRDLAEGF